MRSGGASIGMLRQDVRWVDKAAVPIPRSQFRADRGEEGSRDWSDVSGEDAFGETAMRIHKLKTRYQYLLRATVLPPSALYVAGMSGPLLTPIAFLACVLGAWRLTADLGWTSDFFIARGWLSRYQLWFAVAIAAQTSALLLNRVMKTRKLEAVVSQPTEA